MNITRKTRRFTSRRRRTQCPVVLLLLTVTIGLQIFMEIRPVLHILCTASSGSQPNRYQRFSNTLTGPSNLATHNLNNNVTISSSMSSLRPNSSAANTKQLANGNNNQQQQQQHNHNHQMKHQQQFILIGDQQQLIANQSSSANGPRHLPMVMLAKSSNNNDNDWLGDNGSNGDIAQQQTTNNNKNQASHSIAPQQYSLDQPQQQQRQQITRTSSSQVTRPMVTPYASDIHVDQMMSNQHNTNNNNNNHNNNNSTSSSGNNNHHQQKILDQNSNRSRATLSQQLQQQQDGPASNNFNRNDTNNIVTTEVAPYQNGRYNINKKHSPNHRDPMHSSDDKTFSDHNHNQQQQQGTSIDHGHSIPVDHRNDGDYSNIVNNAHSTAINNNNANNKRQGGDSASLFAASSSNSVDVNRNMDDDGTSDTVTATVYATVTGTGNLTSTFSKRNANQDINNGQIDGHQHHLISNSQQQQQQQQQQQVNKGIRFGNNGKSSILGIGSATQLADQIIDKISDDIMVDTYKFNNNDNNNNTSNMNDYVIDAADNGNIVFNNNGNRFRDNSTTMNNNSTLNGQIALPITNGINSNNRIIDNNNIQYSQNSTTIGKSYNQQDSDTLNNDIKKDAINSKQASNAASVKENVNIESETKKQEVVSGTMHQHNMMNRVDNTSHIPITSSTTSTTTTITPLTTLNSNGPPYSLSVPIESEARNSVDMTLESSLGDTSSPLPMHHSNIQYSPVSGPLNDPMLSSHHIGSISPEASKSSMSRPLYVLGNPISESDTNPTSLNNGLQHSNSHTEQQQPDQGQVDNRVFPSQQFNSLNLNKQQQTLKNNNNDARLHGQEENQSHQNAQSIVKTSTHGDSYSTFRGSNEMMTIMDDRNTVANSNSSMQGQSLDQSKDIERGVTNTQQVPLVSTPERIGGPPLMYMAGVLKSSTQNHGTTNLNNNTHPFDHQDKHVNSMKTNTNNMSNSNSAAAARLFVSYSGAANPPVGIVPRKPSLPPPVGQGNQASGFRSPSSSMVSAPSSSQLHNAQQPLPLPTQSQFQSSTSSQQFSSHGSISTHGDQLPHNMQTNAQTINSASSVYKPSLQDSIHHSLIPSLNADYGPSRHTGTNNQLLPSTTSLALPSSTNQSNYSRRPINITRVEHISAECSNELIRTNIVFNGTFKGIIYSSGYVNDPTCLYVNGSGTSRYDFNIRLNQCGTLGRQELIQPTNPGEARRRDQVMWNTLSIQYNPMIEQEWDEHFRVSCEYGSDFWKTVSFSPFNVETNTGSPVVFTINPPQCQMDVLLGHGFGPKIAVVDGPVTVGDPLTLLIHMKSEKAGYDILVKNCIAHNGAQQRMQLIDSNGCVVNERFISPFRGTYNDNDLRHVTLYAYLKAFRFTGTPVLYLECEIHMCQSACPPQMCYWRRLSKRSVENSDYEYTNATQDVPMDSGKPPIMSDSLSLFKAIRVKQEPEPETNSQIREDDSLVCYRHIEVFIFFASTISVLIFVTCISVIFCLKVRKLKYSHKHVKMSFPNTIDSNPSWTSRSTCSGTMLSNKSSNRLYHHGLGATHIWR